MHQWRDAEVELAFTMDFLYEQRLRKIRDRLPVERFVVARVPEYLPIPARPRSRLSGPAW